MFACIYIPDFPVAAIVRSEPQLRERGVAALNERARLIGMNVVMTKLQAAIFAGPEEGGVVSARPEPRKKTSQIEFSSRRAKRQPKLTAVVLRQRSPAQEESSHAALLDVAHAFTPRVEDTHPDRLLLDLDGMERLYGSAATMARELASRVSTVGLECNIGMAVNPEAAMHAACGFSGTTVVPAGEEAKRLGVLPIAVLLDSFDIACRREVETLAATRERAKFREQMLDTLERWGVRDFRRLALLPEHALASRLGEAGTRLQRLSRGEGIRTLALCELPVHFEEAMELESAVETIESLSFLMNRLLEQLCARLDARALAVQELKLSLQLERRVSDEQPGLLRSGRWQSLRAHSAIAGGHARSQSISETAAVGPGSLPTGSACLQTVDCSRTGTPTIGATGIVSAHYSGGRKAGDNARPHYGRSGRTPCRNC
jgi:protein ImuB